MSRWFRHYAGMMRDDKLVRVAIRSKQTIERVVWVWGAILESAAEIDDSGRYDVDSAELAYFLRTDQADTDGILAGLADAGRVASGCVVNWGSRQFTSDRSKDRVAAYRERKRSENVVDNGVSASRNGDVTLQERHCNAPETETETETKVRKKEGTADAASDYAFSGRVIRLTATDLAKWQKSYPAIPDIVALLQSRDDWLATEADTKMKAKWFISTSNWLASQNAKAITDPPPGARSRGHPNWGPGDPGHSGIPL